jgi:ABC-type uncharacterized transport system YnjBCD ATPase subunit
VRSLDTTADADAVQLALYRQMTASQRVAAAAAMSVTARELALAGIRHRHPDYGADQARLALFRMLVGDELFRRVWPGAALLAP